MAEIIKKVTSTSTVAPKTGAIQTSQMSVNTPVTQSVAPNMSVPKEGPVTQSGTFATKNPTPAVAPAPVTVKTQTVAPEPKPYVQSVAITPEIQAEMDRFPGITAEAAAGNLAMRQTQSGYATSEPAKKYFDSVAKETAEDATRFRVGAEELKRMQDEARAGGLNVDQYAARSTTNSKATMYSDIPEIAALDAEYEAENRRYEEYMAKAEARNQQMIQMIRDNYSRQREEQKVANQNRLKAQEILGTRSGRQRYAPEIQQGLMSAEEKAGLQRLSDLQREEEQLVMQAVAAQEAEEFEMLGKMFAMKQEKRKEQNAILQQMYENSLKKEETAIKKMNAEKEQRKGLIEDLDFFAKSGMSLDDESGAFIDNLLGYGKGASQAYVEAQKATNSFERMGKMFDFLGKVPADQVVTMPDGSKVSGLKEVDYTKNMFRTTETDNYGNVTDIFTKFNPSTGQMEIVNTVDYGQIGKMSDKLLEQTSAELGLSEDQKKRLYDLQDKSLKDPDIKGFLEIRDSFNKVKISAEKKTGPGDMSLIFGYMKMLDPGSTVREGEYASAEQATNIPGYILNQYNKAVDGKKLTDKQRNEFVSVADGIFKDKKRNYEKAVEFYKSEATFDGLPVERVIRDLENIKKPTEYGTLDDWVASDPSNVKILEQAANYIKAQGVKDATEQEILETVEFLQGFNKPLSKGEKGSTYSSGTVTGYGSKLWKPGLDYVVKGGKGAQVTSPFDGVIVDVIGAYSNKKLTPLPAGMGKQQNKGFGNQVKIRRSDGTEVWLSHLDSVANLRKGQKIARNTVVGTQGNTGSTYGNTGVHVDITMVKPKGGYYTAQEVEKLLRT